MPQRDHPLAELPDMTPLQLEACALVGISTIEELAAISEDDPRAQEIDQLLRLAHAGGLTLPGELTNAVARLGRPFRDSEIAKLMPKLPGRFREVTIGLFRQRFNRSEKLKKAKSKADQRRRSVLGQKVLKAIRAGTKLEVIVAEHAEARDGARAKALVDGGDEHAAEAAARNAGWSRSQICRFIRKARSDGRLPGKATREK